MANSEAIKDFLASTPLGEYLDEFHKPVAALSKANTVGDALKTLADLKVLSAPVVDEEGEYVGAISTADVLKAVMKSFQVNFGENWVETANEITPEQVKEVAAVFLSKPLASVAHAGDLWMKGDTNTTLLTVVNNGFMINQPPVHHRIFICDPAKQEHHVINKGHVTVVNIKVGSEKESASAWRATDVCSQSDMVALLYKRKDVLAAVLGLPIEQLELYMGKVMTVSADVSAMVAFEQMAVDHKSCLGVTDPATGRLIGNLSLSDIRHCNSPEAFALLKLPVAQFIRATHGLPQAEGSDYAALLKEVGVLSVPQGSTVGTVLDALVPHRLHRVYVVDGNGAAVGIITLTDILRAFAKH